MKRENFFTVMIALGVASTLMAQSGGPYTIRTSPEFESPGGHALNVTIPYDGGKIIQVNNKGVKSFNFQEFDSSLKLVKENTVDFLTHFDNPHIKLDFVSKLKSKMYVFVRDVNREAKTEGISAIEISPEKLDFVGKPISLYQSSGKVWGGIHETRISEDRSKILYKYQLVPADKRDKFGHPIVGLYSFDDNLKKLWGGEYKMPYADADMEFISSAVGDDGKFYQLINVVENSGGGDVTRDKTIHRHIELLVYDGNSSEPKILQIRLKNGYTPSETYMFEDENHNMSLAGFYYKGTSGIDGAFMIKLDGTEGNGGYYEIPENLIKQNLSEREKTKLDKKAEKANAKGEEMDLGVDYLEIREIYALPNGSTEIVSEQYHVVVTTSYNGKTTTTYYHTYANDIFVFNIDASSNLAWVKKIAKRQQSGDAAGAGLSFNSYQIGNDVHIFFLDNLENFDLPDNEVPKVHVNNRGGFLVGAQVAPDGKITKYNLGDIKDYETNFYVRYFQDGRNNNLIDVERKRKKNILFSIDMR